MTNPWDDTGIPPEFRLDAFLATSAGSVEMNVDGSSTPVNFDHQAVVGTKHTITRMLAVVVDGSMTWPKFGGLAALTNGLWVRVYESDGTTLVHDLMGGQTAKDNADWANYLGPDGPVTAGAGDDAMPLRWTFEKAGHPLLLANQRILRVTVRDDLTGLAKFRINLQGFWTDSNTGALA